MADLDDFFAKKDKKKKGKKGSKFAKANTDILAQNLIENDKKTEDDEKKAATLLATSEANRAGAAKDNPGVRNISYYILIQAKLWIVTKMIKNQEFDS